MPHMLPDIEHMTMIRVETTIGTETIPDDLVHADAAPEDCQMYLEGKPLADAELERVSGWFARLSAPGYMDCTEWSGPFESEQEAKEHIRDMYDVDPDTGEELDDTDAA
jgi:hypothetical protein